MRILTYTVTPEDAGRAVRSVVPRRFSLGTHAYRRLKVLGGIRINGETARADRILVLDRGRIIEDGTHADLLAACGTYAKLWASYHKGTADVEEPGMNRYP